MGNFLYKSSDKSSETDIKPNTFQLNTENIANKNVLVYGKNGKGKTTLIKHVLNTIPFKNAHIVHNEKIITETYNNVSVKKKITKGINENMIIDLMLDTKANKDEMIAFVVDTPKKCKASKTYQGFLQRIIKTKPFTMFVACNDINQVSKEDRAHMDLIFLFQESNSQYLRKIWETYLMNDITEEEFRKKVLEIKGDYDCLVIDLTTKKMILWPSPLGNSEK